jgi:hypothetical protein
VRPKPQARGRCHNANYWDLTQILFANVDRLNTVTVIRPAAFRTAEHAPRDLAAHILARGAGAARVGLFLQENLHPEPFG